MDRLLRARARLRPGTSGHVEPRPPGAIRDAPRLSDFAEDYDWGAGFALRIRYALGGPQALGISFESQTFEPSNDAPEGPDEPLELKFAHVSVEYLRYFNRGHGRSQYALIGLGLAHPSEVRSGGVAEVSDALLLTGGGGVGGVRAPDRWRSISGARLRHDRRVGHGHGRVRRGRALLPHQVIPAVRSRPGAGIGWLMSARPDYRVGDRLIHAQFGTGLVVEVGARVLRHPRSRLPERVRRLTYDPSQRRKDLGPSRARVRSAGQRGRAGRRRPGPSRATVSAGRHQRADRSHRIEVRSRPRSRVRHLLAAIGAAGSIPRAVRLRLWRTG